MPKGNKEVQEILDKRSNALKNLRVLLNKHFDVKDAEHMKTLKDYLDTFELDLARKEVYKTGNRIMFGYLVYFVITWFFRIDVFDVIATPTLAFGIMCELLNRASKTDYANTITDMKMLYNWVMKDGHDEYVGGLDSTNKMANPQVQRLILLLAPHTTPEFMQAWPKILDEKESTQRSTFGWVVNGVTSSIFSTYSYFTSQPKSEARLDEEGQVRALKFLVEKGQINSGAVKSMVDVVNKMANDPEFRNLVLAGVGDFVKEPVTQFISSVKAGGKNFVPQAKLM